MTPGTLQPPKAQGLRDRCGAFREPEGVEIFGVSFDDPQRQNAAFRQTGELSRFRLLSDTHRCSAGDGGRRGELRRSVPSRRASPISSVPDGKVLKAYGTVEPSKHATPEQVLGYDLP